MRDVFFVPIPHSVNQVPTSALVTYLDELRDPVA